MELGACPVIDPVAETSEASLRCRTIRRPAAGNVRMVLCLVVLFVSSTVHAEALGPAERFCRSDGKEVSPWLVVNQTIQVAEDVSSVGELVEYLQSSHSIPISWIAVQPEELLRMEAKPYQLDDLMRSVAEQHPDYRCEIRSGRLILRTGAKIFDQVIEGVDVSNRYRFVALKQYIEHLRAVGGGFENWILPLVGGLNIETPLFEEKITLAPRAPLLDHLVQLLGRRSKTYFTIPAPGDVPRTIWISELP